MIEDNGAEKRDKYEPKYSYTVNSDPKQPSAVSNALWNSETGEFLGRTALNWGKLLVFYTIFYICLSIFFLLYFWIFWQTLYDDRPKWVAAESLIGTNPGVGFRPMPDQDKNPESTLIWFNSELEQRANESFWVQEIERFFNESYADNANKTGTGKCGYGDSDKKAGPDYSCSLDPRSVKPCSLGNKGYGYAEGTREPCVLIKLNKIFHWNPDPYTNSAEDLKLAQQNGMPESLVKRIIKLGNENSKEMNTVWVSCEGENPADRENMGPIQVWAPNFDDREFPGLPNYYFPYMKQDSYKAPFVFVKFIKPQPNVIIQVECKAWAKNIVADRQLRLGSVHFELMID